MPPPAPVGGRSSNVRIGLDAASCPRRWSYPGFVVFLSSSLVAYRALDCLTHTRYYVPGILKYTLAPTSRSAVSEKCRSAKTRDPYRGENNMHTIPHAHYMPQAHYATCTLFHIHTMPHAYYATYTTPHAHYATCTLCWSSSVRTGSRPCISFLNAPILL